MFHVAEGGRKLTNDVGRSPKSFGAGGIVFLFRPTNDIKYKMHEYIQG